MRASMNTFFSSGPWGAVISALSAPVFAFVKPALLRAITGVLGVEPEALAGVVIPLGAIPIYFGIAIIFGYLGGVFGGLLKRRCAGIVLGGILGGFLTNVFFTLS